MYIKNDEVMEERSEFDYEQITNKPPSLTPQPINNPLPIKVEPIQQIKTTLVYVFLETFATYTQHESLKHISLLFEQTYFLKHKFGHRL